MPRWPLLLPPPAVSTSPSRLRHSSSSIVVESPSRRPSPSSCRRAVHRRSAAPSITINSPSRRPSPPIAVVLLVHRRRARAVPCRRGAVVRRPSLLRSRRAPSLAVEEPSRHPLPSRSRRAIPCRRGAVAPSIAVEEPLRRTSPSRSRRPCRLTNPATCHTPPRWLSRCLSSRRRLPSAGASHCGIAFPASRPSGWLSRLLASHAATSHLPAPPPLIAPLPLVMPLSGLSSGWLRRRLSSRRRHLSAG
jgi:hypothetical protein